MHSLYAPIRSLSAQTPRELPPFLRLFKVPAVAQACLFLSVILPLILIPLLYFTKAPPSPLTGRAQGRIVQVERFRQLNGATNEADQTLFEWQFVKYRFNVQGRDFIGAVSRCAPFPLGAETLRAGQVAQIAYNPKKPTFNLPASQLPPQRNTAGDWGWLLMFPILGLLAAAMSSYSSLSGWWRARKTIQNGALAQGRVIWAKSGASSNNPHSSAYTLEVEFEDEAQRTHTIHAPCDNAWLIAHLPPNALVVVAYQPKNPVKSAVVLETFAS